MNKNSKTLAFWFWIVLLFSGLLFIPFIGSAVANPQTTLSVPFPTQSGQPVTQISGPAEYIQVIFKFSLGIGALLAMAMIVFGALEYTLSEVVTKKEDARDRILKALWGLVLLIAATLILSTINPQLPNLQAPSLNPIPQQPSAATPNTTPVCGNGVLDPGETCDPGINQLCNQNADGTYAGVCLSNCQCSS